jgi:hypothetical protein
MGNIKDLPGSGSDFRVTTGVGNFSKKFNSAARVAGSALYNLQDNKKTLLQVIKKSEGAIRIGKFDRLRQRSAYNAVRKIEGSKLTKDDKRDIKLILKHLGGQEEENAEGSNIHIQRQLDRDESFEKERDIKMKSKISRFEQSNSGGEAKLKFASQPEDAGKENLTMSGKLLQRRFKTRELIFRDKLPSHRIQHDRMGPVAPPPAITRENEPHIPNTAPTDASHKNDLLPSSFQNL